jgi:uncharacterized membrane protein YhhN
MASHWFFLVSWLVAPSIGAENGFCGASSMFDIRFSCLAVRDIAYLLETRAKRRISQQKIYFGFILKTHLDTLGALFE